MDIRTENLTILFVDIAGFTATTSRQSRLENAHLLQTFERTLLPLIKRFKGNVVKSIGDALLITFRSPTDAMLCSMALQDAMHAHNLHAVDDDKIHIRVAANLGEVRVTKKDIFGEPVNVASRIEGVTPADEIYLSEAVYMAMNKAEVPALEVGFKQLAGIPQAVRVYSIPRFATHRLVPQNQLPAEQGNELLFPYGGMHQRVPERTHSFRLPSDRSASHYLLLALALIGSVALATIAVRWYGSEAPARVATSAATTAASTAPAADTGFAGNQSPVIEIPREQSTPDAATSTSPKHVEVAAPIEQPSVANSVENAKNLAEKSGTIPAPEPKSARPASGGSNVGSTTTVNKPAATAANKPVTQKPSTPTAAAPAPEPVWSVTSAKAAYRAGQIDKAEYRRIVSQLELDYEAKIRELKLTYRAGKLSETEYEEKVREAKRAYSGR
ncbi:MAG TPA: adenylate/guanylate cyclase domain-containing protein [Permianibacter sp.]|nr:adenylate/guanylate cyclase domain-containing protein [Permianibacter sp.]